MPTKEDMQNLASRIVQSYGERTGKIGQLRRTVKADLGASKAHLKALSRSRAVGERRLRSELGQKMAELKGATGRTLGEARAQLEAVRKEMQASLAQAHATLAESGNRRRADANAFRGKLRRATADGRRAVKVRLAAARDQLKAFGPSRRAAGKEVKAKLAAGHRSLTDSVRRQQGQARDFMGRWAGLVAEGKAGMRARLGRPAGVVARPTGSGMSTTNGDRELSEEEAVARVEIGHVTPEMVALRDRVFLYLADHPDGTRMTELEQEFSLARLQMARVLKSLMEQNKAKKQGLLYFAI